MKKLALFIGVFSLWISQCSFAANTEQNCPALTGDIIAKDSTNYDDARLVSNYYVSKQQYPNIIVYCKNTQDVQNAIRYARCHKLPIRIRSGGHNHEGFSTGTGVVLIDVSHMKKTVIDKNNETVTVQPGVTGGELYQQLIAKGLTQAGGTCPGVGISGLILSGGFGPLLRQAGLACDSLLNVEVVDATGQIIQATKDNAHKDLFWASCGGGGGNFGVATSIKLKVYPAKSVTWFLIDWDWQQPVEKIISTWQTLFTKNDKRWYSNLDLWGKAFASDTFKKQPIKVMGIFWGTPNEAKQTLAPLITVGHPHSVTIREVTWSEAINLFGNTTAVFVSSKPEYYSPGTYLMKPLPAQAINDITTTLRNSNSPLLNILFYTMGGRVKEIAPTTTAFYYRQPTFFMMYSTEWLQKNEDKEKITELNTLRQKISAYTIGDYIGNPDRQFKDYLTTYYGNNVHRLRCIKRKYDPENIFKFEQGIPPAPAEWACER